MNKNGNTINAFYWYRSNNNKNWRSYQRSMGRERKLLILLRFSISEKVYEKSLFIYVKPEIGQGETRHNLHLNDVNFEWKCAYYSKPTDRIKSTHDGNLREGSPQPRNVNSSSFIGKNIIYLPLQAKQIHLVLIFIIWRFCVLVCIYELYISHVRDSFEVIK